MANPDEYDALKGAASGAATGAALGGGPIGAVIGGVAGAATPFISKALGGLFGVTDAEAAEKAALAPLQRVATGGTTQGQAGMAYARARTLQDLANMSGKGNSTQQVIETQARYASQLADLRSKEQERASSQLAYYEGQRAAADAKRKREALSGAIGSAVAMGTKLGMASGAPDPNKLTEADANAYNAQQQVYKPFSAQTGSTSGDLGAAYSARLAQSGAEQARTDLFGGDGQYHAVAPSLASPGSLQLNGQNTMPETQIGGASRGGVAARTPIAPAEDMTGSAQNVTTQHLGITGNVAHGKTLIPKLMKANEELDLIQYGRRGRPGSGGMGAGGAGSI